MESKQYLRAKTRIGQGKINYGSNQEVFHREDLDESVLARKEEVVTFAKGERFLNNKSWNLSNHLNKPVCESKRMENFARDRSNAYQYNYRAESLGPVLNPPEEKLNKFQITLKNSEKLDASITKRQTNALYNPQCNTFKRTQEMPVHPKLQESFHREWNCSSEFNRKNCTEKSNSFLEKSKVNSEKKKKQLNKDTYQTPLMLSAKISREVRRQKEAGTFSVEKPVFQEPEEQVDRKSLVNRYAVEPDQSFITTKHSGVWEKQPDGRFMWSDTGSYVYDSPGDIVIKHNPDHYNYAKPNLSRSTR